MYSLTHSAGGQMWCGARSFSLAGLKEGEGDKIRFIVCGVRAKSWRIMKMDIWSCQSPDFTTVPGIRTQFGQESLTMASVIAWMTGGIALCDFKSGPLGVIFPCRSFLHALLLDTCYGWSYNKHISGAKMPAETAGLSNVRWNWRRGSMGQGDCDLLAWPPLASQPGAVLLALKPKSVWIKGCLHIHRKYTRKETLVLRSKQRLLVTTCAYCKQLVCVSPEATGL